MDVDKGKSSEGGLVLLYEQILKTICGLPGDKKDYVTIMMDDISLVEVAANGGSDYVLDFLHYCHSLTSEFVRHSCSYFLLFYLFPCLLSFCQVLLLFCLFSILTLFLTQDCSLITLNHEDIYSSMERPTLILQMEYLADILVKAEPLSTGLATDVHGQVWLSDYFSSQ